MFLDVIILRQLYIANDKIGIKDGNIFNSKENWSSISSDLLA